MYLRTLGRIGYVRYENAILVSKVRIEVRTLIARNTKRDSPPFGFRGNQYRTSGIKWRLYRREGR